MMLKEPCKQNPKGQKIHFAPKQSHLSNRVDLLARLVQDSTFGIVLANLFDSGSRWGVLVIPILDIELRRPSWFSSSAVPQSRLN